MASNSEHMPIEESIRSATEIFEKAIETNDIEAALKVVEPLCPKSIYHSFMKATGLIILAVSSFEQADIDRAMEAVNSFKKQSRKLRKHGVMVSAMKMIKTPNYQKYSDLELHAELLHAFYLAMSAGMIAIQKDSTYGIIKVAYRLQKFTKNLKACRKILKKRTTGWENDTSRLNFEAGVRFANGLKNLAISQIPPKILRLINFLGYKGQESVAFEEINKVAFELPGAGARMARAFLIAYAMLGRAHVGLGPKDLDKTDEILKKELEQFPTSLVYLVANAKMVQLRGDIDGSIKMYSDLLAINHSIANKVIYLELMFCNALKCNWDECIKFAQLINKNTTHSPALATYAEAVFRLVKANEDNDPNGKQKATELFKAVPELRIRHLGKTLTPEKIAIEWSIKYIKNNEFLILPETDMLYQANWFVFVRNNQDILGKHLARVDKEVERFKADISGKDDLANYLSAVFYKGALFKVLGKHNEAKECFNTVVKYESRAGKDKSTVVQAVLELGLTDLELGDHESAKKWINKSLNDYSRYLTENYVQMRAYAGLREMGISTDKDKEDEAKLEQYRKEWLKEINVEEKNYEALVQTEEVEVEDEK